MTHPLADADLARRTLDRIDRARRQCFGAFVGAALLEGAGLFAFAWLADFSDRTHLLILIAAVLTYGTIGIGLVALGVYTRWWALRIVQAVQQAGEPIEP